MLRNLNPATMALVVPLLFTSIAHAQPTAHAPADIDADVARLIANERDLALVLAVRANCPDSADGEIVVCAKNQSERFRIPSSQDENPDSPAALRNGALHPPDVYTHPPGGVAIGFGHVPPPIYYFDITALPTPAPGTDADKIAKGEMRAP